MSLKVNQTAKTHNGTPIHRVRFDNVNVGETLVHIPAGELGVVESIEGRRGTVDATIVFVGGKRITRKVWASKSLWKVV